MERRPQRSKRAPSRSLPAPAREQHAYRPAGPDGTVALTLANDGLDPDLRAYLRAPYDPLNAARVTRFVVRSLLQQPPTFGWMRPFTLVVSLLLITGLIGGLASLASVFVNRGPESALIAALQTLLVAGPSGAFGVLLLWRLLSTWNRSPRT